MKFYIAYGSNLSVEQMAFRCPTAEIVGKAVLKDWKLAFGQHATIETWIGAEVPALIWSIQESDEMMLDKYEGYPKYYYKKALLVEITDLDGTHPENVIAMVYIMTDIQKTGKPSQQYYNVIKEGYERFGFDMTGLERALEEAGGTI